MSDLSPEAEALLEISRAGDDPTGRDRKRVRSALAGRIALGVAAGAAVATISKTAASATVAGVASAAAGSASTATTAAGAATAATAGAVTTTAAAAAATTGGVGFASFGISAFGAKLLVSAAIVGAVGAGTVTYTNHRAAQAEDAKTFEAKSAARPGFVAAPARPQSAPLDLAKNLAPEATPPASLEAVPSVAMTTPPSSLRAASLPPTANTPVANAPVASPPPAAAEPAPKASSLSDEIALLQDANAALQSGSAARALGILDEHARRFPHGTLSEEREASRVSALCKLGRVDEAHIEAAQFLRAHPRSPQVPAVRSACASDEAK
ncbi:MAG: hypothetical protein ABIP39_16125 [Polyangiaceae bacterium]